MIDPQTFKVDNELQIPGECHIWSIILHTSVTLLYRWVIGIPILVHYWWKAWSDNSYKRTMYVCSEHLCMCVHGHVIVCVGMWLCAYACTHVSAWGWMLPCAGRLFTLGVHHSYFLNFVLLWIHCLLLFIFVTNNNGITLRYLIFHSLLRDLTSKSLNSFMRHNMIT